MFLPLTLFSLLLSQTLALYFPADDPSEDNSIVQRGVGPPVWGDNGRAANPSPRSSPVQRSTPSNSSSDSIATGNFSRGDVVADTGTLGISLGTPNESLPDPCGPPSQPPGDPSSKSTCHAKLSTADTNQYSTYGVTCLNDGSGEVIEQDGCADTVYSACYQIAGLWGSQYQHTNKWMWTGEDRNCTFGYWLPAGGAPPPDYDRCYFQITKVMKDQCKGPQWNLATVNLWKRPSASAQGITGIGLPVDGGYPSYIMVPQASYCGVNSEDVC